MCEVIKGLPALADTAEQRISFLKTDLKCQPVFDSMSLSLLDIPHRKLTSYEMMRGFSVIRQSRLENDKGPFTYEVSLQRGEGVRKYLIFSDKVGGGVRGFLCSKIFDSQPRTFYCPQARSPQI